MKFHINDQRGAHNICQQRKRNGLDSLAFRLSSQAVLK